MPGWSRSWAAPCFAHLQTQGDTFRAMLRVARNDEKEEYSERQSDHERATGARNNLRPVTAPPREFVTARVLVP